MNSLGQALAAISVSKDKEDIHIDLAEIEQAYCEITESANTHVDTPSLVNMEQEERIKTRDTLTDTADSDIGTILDNLSLKEEEISQKFSNKKKLIEEI